MESSLEGFLDVVKSNEIIINFHKNYRRKTENIICAITQLNYISAQSVNMYLVIYFILWITSIFFDNINLIKYIEEKQIYKFKYLIYAIKNPSLKKLINNIENIDEKQILETKYEETLIKYFSLKIKINRLIKFFRKNRQNKYNEGINCLSHFLPNDIIEKIDLYFH